MTRKFNIRYTCEHCGRQSTAETAFGRWMRNHIALDSVDGIVRTDLDHIVLRYKTSLDGRDFQLLMLIEVKEFGAHPDPAQTDCLSFIRQMAERRQRNRHGANGFSSVKLRSRMLNRPVNVRFYGVHLLQFERTNPHDSSWIKWDGKIISPEELVGVIALERRPDDFKKFVMEFLRDRHSKTRQPLLPLPHLTLTAA